MKTPHKGNHKYERTPVGRRGNVIYRCTLPGCSHMHTIPERVINSFSRCWGSCGRDVIITREMFSDHIRRPMCDACRQERLETKAALASIPKEGEA